MPADVNISRTIAIVVSALGLLCACGLGPVRTPPPPPPPSPVSVSSQYLRFTAAPGTTSPPQQVTLANHSPDQTVLIAPELRSAVASQPVTAFHYDTTCGPTLAPGASCTLTLTPSPGEQNFGSLQLPFPGEGTLSIALNGIVQKRPDPQPDPQPDRQA